MQIVIVGAGTVGYDVSVHLQKVGHDVALVEEDSARCAEIAAKLDILVVEGSGSSPQALEAAGIRQAGLLLAVTSVDEVNILACGLARQAGVETRIARIRSREYTGRQAQVDLENLGVTRVIDPEWIVVRVIDRIARIPEAVEVFGFHGGKIIIARQLIGENMPIRGKTLMEARQLAGAEPLLAVSLTRAGKTHIPTGQDRLEVGDDVSTIFPREALPSYQELLGLSAKKARRAVVAGNSLVAIHLCEALGEWVDDVVLLDPDREHGEMAAKRLDGVEVLRGDPSSHGVLQDLNIEKADLFIGAGNDTNRNVMSALLARSEGARRVMAISYDPGSNRLFRELGVNHVVSPRRAMSGEIMDIIHRGRMSLELHMRDVDVDVVGLLVDEGSRLCEDELHKTWMPVHKQAIAGAVFRGEDAFIPRGKTRIRPGDELIVVTKPKAVSKVSRLFKGR